MRYILITINKDGQQLDLVEGFFAHMVEALTSLPNGEPPEYAALVEWMLSESNWGWFHFAEGVVIKVRDA